MGQSGAKEPSPGFIKSELTQYLVYHNSTDDFKLRKIYFFIEIRNIKCWLKSTKILRHLWTFSILKHIFIHISIEIIPNNQIQIKIRHHNFFSSICTLKISSIFSPREKLSEHWIKDRCFPSQEPVFKCLLIEKSFLVLSSWLSFSISLIKTSQLNQLTPGD